MKNIQTLLITCAAILLFTACEKKEIPEVFDSISGVLTAGENVTAEELSGLPLALCQFKNDGDISTSSINVSTFDFIEIITLDDLGKFEFTNITPGNYFIGLNEFIFTADSVYRFNFDGSKALNIKQTINRNPADNIMGIFMPCKNSWACIDMANYSGPELTFIKLYGQNFYGESMTEDHTVEIINGTIQCMPRTVAVEYIDGGINIAFNSSTSSQCSNNEDFRPMNFILGFADGKGGTLYSEKIALKEFSSDGSCEGLPQTIGTTTISFKPGTGYVLSNN